MGTDNAVDMSIKGRGASAAGNYKRRGVKEASETYNDLPAREGAKGKILGNTSESRMGDMNMHSVEGFGSGKNSFTSDDDGDDDFYNNLAGGKGAKAVDGFSNSSGVIGGKV